MTGPAIDPLDALKALKAPNADPLEQLKALRPPGHDYHAEYASGALERRMAGANARDVANAAEETEPVGPVAAAGHALGATAANLGEGIPGFEAVQAGTRSLVRGEPYREALGDLRHETGKLPTALKTGERIVGAMPLSKFLPGSAARGGAILGGASGALEADPDQGLLPRAIGTGAGAVGGALVGKLGELAVTGARTIAAPTAAANVLARKAQQALSARKLYSTALAEGQGKGPTPEVSQFLAQPDIAEIVGELQQTRPFQGVQPHEPKMLDAVYKTLSDRVAQLRKGLESPTPNRPNIGRFRMQDTKAAQGDLLDAVSGGTSMPGPMPTYRDAVQDFAQQAKGIEGVNKGYDALRTRIGKTLPRSANLTKTTPESLEEWSRAADDASKEAAGEGVLGGVKTAGGAGLGRGFKALRKAPYVMRDAGVPAQSMSDMLTKLGLLSGTAALQP